VTVNGNIVLQETPADFAATTYLLITDPTRFGLFILQRCQFRI